jgi:hypothetical protein
MELREVFYLAGRSVWERDLSCRLPNQTGQVTIKSFRTKKKEEKKKKTTRPDNFLSAFVWSISSPGMEREARAQQPIRVKCAAYDTGDSHTSPFRQFVIYFILASSETCLLTRQSRISANQTVWPAMLSLFMPFCYPSLLLLNYVKLGIADRAGLPEIQFLQ